MGGGSPLPVINASPAQLTPNALHWTQLPLGHDSPAPQACRRRQTQEHWVLRHTESTSSLPHGWARPGAGERPCRPAAQGHGTGSEGHLRARGGLRRRAFPASLSVHPHTPSEPGRLLRTSGAPWLQGYLAALSGTQPSPKRHHDNLVLERHVCRGVIQHERDRGRPASGGVSV